MFVSEVDSKLSTLREFISRLDALNADASGTPLDLSLVTGITLHSNRLKEIDRAIMSKFVSLTVLDLSSNLLEYIAGLEDLHQLTELNLANNRITKIENLRSLQALQVLNLSFNKIKSLEGMEQLGRGHPLQVLNVKGNEIEGLDMLLYLRGCESLKHLTLGGDESGFKVNPICQAASYRKETLAYLPQLESLDGKSRQAHQYESVDARLSALQTQVEALLKAQNSSRNVVQPAGTSADTARILRLYDEMRELRDAAYAEQRARLSNNQSGLQTRSEDFRTLEARLDTLIQAIAKRDRSPSSSARKASAHSWPQKSTCRQSRHDTTDETKRGPRFSVDSENVPPDDDALSMSSSSSEFRNSKSRERRSRHNRPVLKEQSRQKCATCGNGTLFEALKHEEKRLRENEKELLAQIDSLARELRSERDARTKFEESSKKFEQQAQQASANREQVVILQTKNAELEKAHAATKQDLDVALKGKNDAEQSLKALTADAEATKKQLAEQEEALHAARLAGQNEHDLSVALEGQLHAAEEDNARISIKWMKEREASKIKLAKAGKESEIYRDTIQQLQREVSTLHQKIASGDYDGRHQLQDFSRHMKAELKSEITEVKAAIAESHKEELNAVTKQLASTREAYVSLEEEYRKAVKEQRQAAHLKDVCAELSQQCFEQATALEQRAQKEHEMADVIKALTGLLNEQKAQIREMTVKHENDIAAFEMKDKVRELEERLRAMHRLRVELKAAKLEHSNVLKTYKELKAEKEQRREHLEQQERKAQQTIAELKAEVEKLNASIVSLSKDLENAQQTIRIKNTMLEDQNGTIRFLKQNLENKTLSKEEEELKDRLEEETLLKQELQQELETQTELIEHLQGMADDYKSERNGLRADLADVSTKLQERNDSIHLIEEEVARIRSVFGAKEEKWQQEMAAAVHAEERANLDMKISYEAQSSRLAALEREREGILQSLYLLQQDADKMSKMKEQQEFEMRALREELDRQKQKMDEKMKRLQAAFVEN
ncbi:hypothetical protein HDU87_008323 [Geranomyces variabilis]|uniref:Leucine-rich repeat and coiled-coil domain-containing protein 1 n=1 Tax=Geranomyces variabilis TaxID=109894 RepID=A0AAD5TD36_9FUNG|nr:hypothetical protein HDU87_008323 [Geranomyces variabilis]